MKFGSATISVDNCYYILVRLPFLQFLERAIEQQPRLLAVYLLRPLERDASSQRNLVAESQSFFRCCSARNGNICLFQFRRYGPNLISIVHCN